MSYSILSSSVVNPTILLSGLMLVSISGCSDSDSGSTDAISAVNLTWATCEPASPLECSSLEVPVDYNLPDGEKITIALNRLPAVGTATEKLGSLLINPGGPGGSGVDTLLQVVSQGIQFPESILNSYDLIGFDPRGIGGSTAVACYIVDSFNFSELPRNAEDIAQMVAHKTAEAQRCFGNYGPYLTQLGSKNVVRDMESIRVALGDEQLDFLAFSYGPRLAALYLQEYPTQSGRMILDAPMSPNSEVLWQTEGEFASLQVNLDRMLSFCVQSNPACNPSDLESALTARINALAASEDPAARQELDLLGQLVNFGVSEPTVGELAVAPISQYLDSGDPSILTNFLSMVEGQFAPQESGNDTEDEYDSTAHLAVTCADDAIRPDTESLTLLLDRFNTISDLFAESRLKEAAKCAGWPAAIEPLAPIAVDTAPISVVVGGTNDAVTPLHFARQMAQSIGGVFVESHHLGHTVSLMGVSSCVDNIVTRFLVEGILPENAVCPLE